VDNRRMKTGLGVVLRYPDITTGLVDALDSGERNDRARRSQ